MVPLEELNDRASEWLSQGSFPYAGAPETLTRQYLLHPLLSLLNWSDSPRDEFHYISEYKGSMNRKWEDLVARARATKKFMNFFHYLKMK